MNKEQVLSNLRNIANAAFENGSVPFTPKDHAILVACIKFLEGEDSAKTEASKADKKTVKVKAKQ